MTTFSKKVCMLGDFAVGKTSLMRRFVKGIFEDKYLSTIGVKVDRKIITLQKESPNITLTMLIWDLAGGERFDKMMSSYYRGAAGAVIVCDLTRPETLQEVTVRYAHEFWSINANAPLIIVANKADLADQRLITAEDLAAVAAQCRAPYFISSAKTGQNVESLFHTLGQNILRAVTK